MIDDPRTFAATLVAAVIILIGACFLFGGFCALVWSSHISQSEDAPPQL